MDDASTRPQGNRKGPPNPAQPPLPLLDTKTIPLVSSRGDPLRSPWGQGEADLDDPYLDAYWARSIEPLCCLPHLHRLIAAC